MKAIEKKYLVPFILVTCCFALWGFANDITNPMVKAFSKIFRMSVTDGALVQVAFYGGYFAMAVPAALFIRRFSYKAGIMLGLGLYAVGALLFLPARMIGNYYPFLAAYFILTCGLSFLETSSNPYILSMGDEATATRRLNLAQAFNPIGSLLGMFVAMNFIQAKLNPLSTSERALLSDAEFEAVKAADLGVLSRPYIAIAAVLIVLLILMFVVKMPDHRSLMDDSTKFGPTVRRLWANRKYRYGVLAQFFYVGVQIMCWTFIIQYGTHVFTADGMAERDAEVLSQTYNIVAMAIFCVSRFICTFLLKFAKPTRLLGLLAGVGGFAYFMHVGSGSASHASGMEMNAIASSIIGGTMLTGGVGNIIGTFFGVLSLSTIQNIVSSAGLDQAWWTGITIAAMLCLFLVIQSIVMARKKRALRAKA